MRGDGFVGYEAEESHASLCANHINTPGAKSAAAIQAQQARSGHPDRLESTLQHGCPGDFWHSGVQAHRDYQLCSTHASLAG